MCVCVREIETVAERERIDHGVSNTSFVTPRRGGLRRSSRACSCGPARVFVSERKREHEGEREREMERDRETPREGERQSSSRREYLVGLEAADL